MRMRSRQPVALVTGGAVRLGRTLCAALVAGGYRVVIHCHRSQGAAARLARRLNGGMDQARVCCVDLSLAGAPARLVTEAQSCYGQLDVLINNAAVFDGLPLTGTPEAALRRELEINFMAPLLLVKAFAEQLKRGRIINILDTRIARPAAEPFVYALAKKALAAATRMAALELAPNIFVNAVAPGPVLPPVRGAHREPAGRLPLGRRPKPVDVAQAVMALLAMNSTTGQIVYVDAGRHLV